MKMRNALLLAAVALLVGGSLAAAQSGGPVGYVVEPDTASGGHYHLTAGLRCLKAHIPIAESLGNDAIVEIEAGCATTEFSDLEAGGRLGGHVQPLAVPKGCQKDVVILIQADRLGEHGLNRYRSLALHQPACAEVLEPDLRALHGIQCAGAVIVSMHGC